MKNGMFESTARTAASALPGLDYRHMLVMTDSTGMLQHAKYSIPNREHGYCIDDNARALIVACRAGTRDGGAELARVIPIYLSFMQHAFNQEHGRFRNFMSYERCWLEEMGSEDSHGRALWGLGVAAVAAPLSSQRTLATRLFEDGLGAVEKFQAPRARAFAMLGIEQYLRKDEGMGSVRELLERLAGGLYDRFVCNSRENWEWCEHYVTYDNAMLPLALLLAGHRLGNAGMKDVALRSLRWLVQRQVAAEGHLSIIGNDGWMRLDGHHAQFDQQPLDASALTLACFEAYRNTGDPLWLTDMYRAVAWFTGDNDLGLALYDPETGGCCDGLHSAGVNCNQGAESTLAWLLARQCIEKVNRAALRPAPNGRDATAVRK